MRVLFSLVVDATPEFTYKGCHLVRSILQHCGGGDTAICVSVTREVSDDTRALFRELGCSVAEIEPFGDGKYCNKIAQLSRLALEEFDVAVLLDTDMIFIENIRPHLRTDGLQAKTVDLPIPSVAALTEIGRLAGLTTFPDITPTDSGEATTYLGNCNGGFLVIPRNLFSVVATEWPKWASWLFEHIEPLRREGKEIHVDQVSLWLTLQANKLPYFPAPSNLNYFVHLDDDHRLYSPEMPLCILHYHDKLNVLGLIDSTGLKEKAAVAAVEKANRQIGQHFDSALFWNFRYHRWPERGSGIGSRNRPLQYKRGLLKREGIERAESVLDVGCGDLEVLHALQPSEYVGLDSSKEALGKAARLRPDWNFRLLDYDDDSIAPADFVLCLEVLIHQPTAADYYRLIGFLCRKTKGTLIVSGYESAGGAGNNHMLFYYEPLQVSLKRTGRFRSVEKIGAHTSVAVYRCLANAPETRSVKPSGRPTRGTGILVCGMHRSGTSALGGALQACGVVLRENMGGDYFNPKGYFEKLEVVKLHEHFFKQFDLSGVSIKPLPEGWEESEAAERTRIRIGDLVAQDFGDDELWAVKDPRLCRLVPLWTRALSEVPLRAILAVRHPLEVAGSLSYLAGYSRRRGLYLWLRFVLEAERNTRGMKRTVVRFEDLLASPGSVVQQIEEELQLHWPNPPEVRAEKLRDWIDQQLNRNSSARQTALELENDDLTRLCFEVFDLFRPGMASLDRERLDAIWEMLPGFDGFDGAASVYLQNQTSLAVLSLTKNYLPDIWRKVGAVDPGWQARAVGDINGDGLPDIVFQNGPLIGALIVNPSGHPGRWHGMGAVDSGWELRGMGDVAGDGTCNLIFQKGALLGYLKLDAEGAIVSWHAIGAVEAGWALHAVADVNGDGRPELLFQQGTAIAALRVDLGGTPAGWESIGAMNDGWTLAAAADIKSDGRPDLIFQNGARLGALQVNPSFQPVAWREMGAGGDGWILPGVS